MQRISSRRRDYCEKYKKRVRAKNRQVYCLKRKLLTSNTKEETKTITAGKIEWFLLHKHENEATGFIPQINQWVFALRFYKLQDAKVLSENANFIYLLL